jgi:hypothetical protein
MTTQPQPLLPRPVVTIRWCPECGRDDRVLGLPDDHYARGVPCPGVPIRLTYQLAAS